MNFGKRVSLGPWGKKSQLDFGLIGIQELFHFQLVSKRKLRHKNPAVGLRAINIG